jgi:DNA-binding CsgD family transcriptional regulator
MHTNGSSLSVAQRPNSRTDPVMRSPSCKPEGLRPRSVVGFLLLDSSLRPVAFNAEAIRVLSYPNQLANVRPADVFLAERIRESLFNREPSRESPLVKEFRSGRRRYVCRAFSVDSDTKGPSHARIAVLLERAPLGLLPLSPASEQFKLTRRERDALEHLLQGLSNKEIATRMSVSPNTVKAFLRLIMLKMEVSSRAAIVAKIMMTSP